MHRSKIPLRKWVVAIYLMTTNLKGVASMKVYRELGVSQPTAWFMFHRIREAWNVEGGKPLPWPGRGRRDLHGWQGEEQAQQEETQGRRWDRWQDRCRGHEGPGTPEP